MVVKLTADFRIEFISGIAEINENDTFLPSITVIPEVPLTNTEELYVAFENGVGSTYANHLFYDADINGYTASIPDGILALGAGTWEFQILRRRYETQNRGRYVEKASVVATFTVAEGVKTVSGTAVTGADLQTIYTVSVQAKNNAETAAAQAEEYAQDALSSRDGASDYASQADGYAQAAYSHSVNASDAKYAAQRAENAAYGHSVDAQDAAEMARKFVEQIGDAGALTFKPVTELPTDNISTNIIYLVPVDDGTDKNRFEEYIYVDGAWETLGTVAINVDHSEYVKFTDYAGANTAGVVKVNQLYGANVGVNGVLYIRSAYKADIDGKISEYLPITTKFQDYAWKVAATTNTETWTDEEKASARATIGAVGATDIATTDKAGLVRVGEGLSISASTNKLNIAPAATEQIVGGTGASRPITVGNYKFAVKNAITTNTETLTDDEKASACEWLGALQKITWQSTYPNVYIKNANGTQGTLAVTTAPFGGGVVQRYDSGQIHVPKVPTAAVHATSKAYVDGLVAELLARIQALENK